MAAHKRKTAEVVRLMLVPPPKHQASLRAGPRLSVKELARLCGLRVVDGRIVS